MSEKSYSGGDSSSSKASAFSSIYDSISESADQTSENIVESLQYAIERADYKKEQNQENRRYKTSLKMAEKEAELKRRQVEAGLADAALGRRMAQDKETESLLDKEAKKMFNLAVMRGLYTGLGNSARQGVRTAPAAQLGPRMTAANQNQLPPAQEIQLAAAGRQIPAQQPTAQAA